MNGELYFVRSTRSQGNPLFDVEIWKTNGTSSGTQLVFRTPFSANSYGLNIGRSAYDSTYDFHKPAYSLGYRTYFVH